jgi:periplasmic mercuric ion binding protein
MKKLFAAMMVAAAAVSSTTVLAAEQTIKLSVPGMYCESCPYIIKKAISAVKGVKLVEATLEDRTATVTFDDTVASIKAITQATMDVGYESSVIDSTNES